MDRDIKSAITQEILQAHFFPLFGQEISQEKRDAITKVLTIITTQKGELLFREGDESDYVYTILSGRMEVFITMDNQEISVGQANRGETIGEMALVTGDNRTASVRSMRNCVLARLNNDDFVELCYQNPDFAISIARVSIERLKSSNRPTRKILRLPIMAIIASDASDVTSSTMDLLIECFKESKRVFVFDAQTIEHKFRHVDMFVSDMRIHLDYFFPDLEIDFDHILIDMRDIHPSICRELYKYSDVGVIFCNPMERSHVANIDQVLAEVIDVTKTKIQLVRCYLPGSAQPVFNQVASSVDKSAHIVCEKSDVMRLYRYLTGNSIGLALGGGGAKGLAHIGVIKALEEQKIPIDFICGTSMGAIVAATYAYLKSGQKLETVMREIFSKNPTNWRDISIIPIFSIYKGNVVQEELERVFGDLCIEHLWLPFFCISSNLTDSEMNVQRTGLLKEVVLASMSVPGLFPPAILNGKLHVDGAIFNNIPIDIMMQEGLGHLMASRVDQESFYPLGTKKPPRGWNKLSYLFKKDNSYPSLLSTFMKTTMANCEQHAKSVEASVDIFFKPRVEHYGLLQWEKFDELVEEGYRHTMQLLAEKNFEPNV